MATDHEGYLFTAKGKTKGRGIGYTVWVILQDLSWSEPKRDLDNVSWGVEGFSTEIAEIINAAIVSR